MSTWYRAGVVTVTEASATVVGVGTLFSLNVTPGDIFTRDGNKVYEILTVNSNTQLTLKTVYAEATAASISYAIIQRPGDPLETDVLNKIQSLLVTWNQREEDIVEWMTGSSTINGTGFVVLTKIDGTTTSIKSLAKMEADFTAQAKTAAGAMVTGNTETGIAVTYQVADQTLDFELQYAGSGGTFGVATTVARSDHSHTVASTGITDWAEAVQDTVGAMVSSNTETGITVTYDDTTGKLNFAVSDLTYGINAITDVVILGAISGNLLQFDGANWVNRSLAAAGVSAVGHTHVAADVTSGTFAIARIPTGTTSSTVALGNHNHALSTLSGVAIVAPAANNLLAYNGTSWANLTASAAGLAVTGHTHDASTVLASGTVPLARLPTGTTGSTIALGNHTHTSTQITDWTEAVEDTVGAMVGSNAETGVAVTYNDTTGKLDFAVLYSGNGVANTAARSDHSHSYTFSSASVTDWTEAVQDTAAGLFSGATQTGLSVTYDDATGKLNTSLSYLSGGTYGVATQPARADHSHAGVYATTADWTEAVQDTVGAMVSTNTETGIAVTYDDATAKLNFAVTYGTTAGTAAAGNHTHSGVYAVVGANTFTAAQTISGTQPELILNETDTASSNYTQRLVAGEWQLFKGAASATGLRFNGTTLIANNVTLTSDGRLKQDVATVQNPLALVEALEGVSFVWSQSGRDDFGVIAQDVREVLPELVHEDAAGYLSVNYTGLVPILIEAVKELSRRVAELEAR